MFEPDRYTHQSVANAELGALCWREPLVRRRCRVRDQAFRVTEIVADANKLERILKTERAALAAFDFKSNERRAAAHLLLHNRGLWMIRPARIDEPRNFRMSGDRDRKRCRAVGLPPHAHSERLKPFEQHPRVKRRHRRAGLPDKNMDLVYDEFLRAENNATEAAALAIDMLGGRVHDAIGAKRQRALKQR